MHQLQLPPPNLQPTEPAQQQQINSNTKPSLQQQGMETRKVQNGDSKNSEWRLDLQQQQQINDNNGMLKDEKNSTNEINECPAIKTEERTESDCNQEIHENNSAVSQAMVQQSKPGILSFR